MPRRTVADAAEPASTVRSIQQTSPILLLSVTSDTLPLINVNDFADTQLAQQISQISGVAQVSIGGQQKPAIRIQIDPAKLVARVATRGCAQPDRHHHRR
jgi:multidrug efflux pump subunit AcrB